ncbi:MAG TPA: hypothetical protein VFB21_20990 [Chthonomonadaceae bacterium]|jgi:hypothetical protein|nr:hypothetical protein [Chthonomonadaceae bacterium]
MSSKDEARKRLAEREAARCARVVFREIIGRLPRPEAWYVWYLCERHGGPPLVDDQMPPNQIAYWDGEDIVIDGRASIADLVAAMPEELTHRLTSRETPRFERMNYGLQHAHEVGREVFQEMVGQRVAALFAQARERQE